jgi:hypothetical protein
MLKKLYIIVFIIFFIAVATSIGLFYMYSRRIDEANNRKSDIERRIKALKETEQRLVLVKDRLSKVEQISNMESAEEKIKGLNFLFNNKTSSVSINEVKADDKLLDISIFSNATYQTFDFMNLIKDSEEFSTITIKSMQFAPKTGFETNLLLNN